MVIPHTKSTVCWGLMQVMHSVIGGVVHSLALPAPEDPVLPGIRWGRYDDILGLPPIGAGKLGNTSTSERTASSD